MSNWLQVRAKAPGGDCDRPEGQRSAYQNARPDSVREETRGNLRRRKEKEPGRLQRAKLRRVDAEVPANVQIGDSGG